MPPSRITNTAKDFNPGFQINASWCKDTKSSANCSTTGDIEKSNGQINTIEFWCDSGFSARQCKLLKNNLPIWNDKINGGIADPVDSIKQIGDNLAISYMASDPAISSTLHVMPVVIFTNMDSFIAIKNAFAPNELLGKLAYFLNKSGKEVLIFDNREVGEYYDQIFNMHCCWDGPSIQIRSDGQIIDFFAMKGNDWYHVQAGDASILSSLTAEGK